MAGTRCRLVLQVRDDSAQHLWGQRNRCEGLQHRHHYAFSPQLARHKNCHDHWHDDSYPTPESGG